MAAGPLPVSPGSAAGGLVRDRCPAFSWSLGESGHGYELVVYSLSDQQEPEASPALAVALPAGAQSWTPSAERCLAAGERYAWSVRPAVPEGEWSEAAIFEIAEATRDEVVEALETLRRYLDGPSRGVGGPGGFSGEAGDDLPLGQERATRREPPRTPSRAEETELPEEARLFTEALAAAGGWDAVADVLSLKGMSHSSGKAAIHAVESSSGGVNYGVRGESASSAGRGVYGLASATTGTTYGVYGSNSSPGGRGVYGAATSFSGTTYGVYGWNASTRGRGVYGLALNPSGTTFGLLGESWSTEGTGVHGQAIATTGPAFGVVGKTASADGAGVYGENTGFSLSSSSGSPGFGVVGEGFWGGVYGQIGATKGFLGFSPLPNAAGVVGEHTSTAGQSAGVFGRTWSSSGYGVYGAAEEPCDLGFPLGEGWCATGGYGGFFRGKVRVTHDLKVDGTLTKGAGSFKIDHPLDPANRYLSHSFVESPDMMNVYNGNATLDGNGVAWVEMPEWFEALNRDFRYQLTALYRPAPGLYVAEAIAGNRFRIAGGEPGMEVSWQVTGVRRDAYARVHPIVVEEDKGELRGHYLHPEAHGQPPELAISRGQPREAELAEPVEVAEMTEVPEASAAGPGPPGSR